MPGPTLAELTGDPPPHLAALRSRGPVHFIDELGGYLVVTHQAAVEVLRDPDTFTVDDPRFSTAQVIGRSMLSTDGDEHNRHRMPFVAPFRPRQVDVRFGRDVGRHVDRLLDRLLEPVDHVDNVDQVDHVDHVNRVDRVDYVDHVDHVGQLDQVDHAGLRIRGGRRADLRIAFAAPLAAAVMATALGLDGDDPGVVSELVNWYGDIVASVAGIAEGRAVTVEGAAAMRALVTELDRHRSTPSVLSAAAAAGELSSDELHSNAAVILFGGVETTEATILNTIWFHLRSGRTLDPDDSAAVGAAVEESLRLEPAAALLDRYTTRQTSIDGVVIPAGALVSVSLTAANRDPAVFEDPDDYRPERPALRRHLTFATGPHVCLGMDLARLEAALAVAALLRRLPGVRLAPDCPGPVGLVFRKPQRLPVLW